MNYDKIISCNEDNRVSISISKNKEDKKFSKDTVETIYNLITKENINGLTILGEDLLSESSLNDLFLVYDMINYIHLENKTVWLYTKYTKEEISLAYTKAMNLKNLLFGFTIDMREDIARYNIIESCDKIINLDK